jgi:hypothetical protein
MTGTVMVLLSHKKRVRHLAVWGQKGRAAPLCRNSGDFPRYGNFHDWPNVPICTRCADEVALLASAVQVAGWGS